jgi:hypothetical protein
MKPWNISAIRRRRGTKGESGPVPAASQQQDGLGGKSWEVEGLQSLGLGGWLGGQIPNRGQRYQPCSLLQLSSLLPQWGRWPLHCTTLFPGRVPRAVASYICPGLQGSKSLLLGQRMADSSFFFLVNNDTE